MFATVSNASKFGFIKLAQWLDHKGFLLIDCQQNTPHHRSLGAEMMDGQVFYNILKHNILEPTRLEKWGKIS